MKILNFIRCVNYSFTEYQIISRFEKQNGEDMEIILYFVNVSMGRIKYQMFASRRQTSMKRFMGNSN